uniref:Uncharacterized protein n=1 Tax=viral metagenome TaxID=1070528 RepID=A0A6C0D1E4_9ZZZZ
MTVYVFPKTQKQFVAETYSYSISVWIFMFAVTLGVLLTIFIIGAMIYLFLTDSLLLLHPTPFSYSSGTLISTSIPSSYSFASPSPSPSSSSPTPKPPLYPRVVPLCTPKNEDEWKIQSTMIKESPTDSSFPLSLFLLSSFPSFSSLKKKYSILGRYSIKNPLRTFQIHLYFKYLTNHHKNGVIYWGWSSSTVTQPLYPIVLLPDIQPNLSCIRYTVLQSSDKNPPASLYIRYSVQPDNSESFSDESAFAVMIYEDDSNPSNYIQQGKQSSEQMTSFCLQ